MLLGSKRRSLHRHLAGLAFLLTLTGAQCAWALDDSDKEAIRTLSNEAAAEFEQGQFESARDKFARAYAIAKVPRLAVWAARASERLGKLVAAYEFYRQAVRLERNELWVGDLQNQAQRDAEEALERVTPRLAKLKVLVEGAEPKDVSVQLDGASIPSALLAVERLVDPGKHEIVGVRGKDQAKEVASLDEGGSKTVVLKFAFRPKTKDEPVGVAAVNQPRQPGAVVQEASSSGSIQSTVGWVSLGVGIAGLATGGVAGYLTRSKYYYLEERCPDLQCDGRFQTRVDNYRRMRTIATVGFIAGGVGSALGVTLLLTSPKDSSREQSAVSLGLWATPEMAGVEGTF